MQDSADEHPHVEQSTRASRFPVRDGLATAKLARKVIRAMVIFMLSSYDLGKSDFDNVNGEFL